MVPDEGELNLTLAFRSPTPPAFAILFLRDRERQEEPLDFTAGGLLPAPAADPISRWGGTADAQMRFFASERLNPQRASELAPASGDPAYGFAFSREAIDALLTLTPRDGVRIDLMQSDGQPPQSLWFEVGMFKSALAVQGLALPGRALDYTDQAANDAQ